MAFTLILNRLRLIILFRKRSFLPLLIITTGSFSRSFLKPGRSIFMIIWASGRKWRKTIYGDTHETGYCISRCRRILTGSPLLEASAILSLILPHTILVIITHHMGIMIRIIHHIILHIQLIRLMDMAITIIRDHIIRLTGRVIWPGVSSSNI